MPPTNHPGGRAELGARACRASLYLDIVRVCDQSGPDREAYPRGQPADVLRTPPDALLTHRYLLSSTQTDLRSCDDSALRVHGTTGLAGCEIAIYIAGHRTAATGSMPAYPFRPSSRVRTCDRSASSAQPIATHDLLWNSSTKTEFSPARTIHVLTGICSSRLCPTIGHRYREESCRALHSASTRRSWHRGRRRDISRALRTEPPMARSAAWHRWVRGMSMPGLPVRRQQPCAQPARSPQPSHS